MKHMQHEPTNGEHRNGHGAPEAAEWSVFRQDAGRVRKDLERLIRRRMVHDPRAARARVQNISPPDLADDAFAWALGEWRSKPQATTPAQWMRKRALQLLDEALDVEALAAESREEERREESRLLTLSLVTDDEERARWLDLLDGGPGDAPEPFDGLEADEDVSSVESRLDETELLEQLDQALARLPERSRRVVVHRFIDELTAEDVAYLLDISTDDVERELGVAVETLRRELTPR